jgi:hypothetical protein
MSAGPRIVFVRFLTVDSPKLAPWVAHAGRVIGAHQGETVATKPSTGLVVWHLVSANNRELARGADVLDTFEGARANASAVVRAADQLSVESVSEAGRGVYGWFASLDDRPIVTCARWYVTDRDRRHSIQLALRSIAIAELHAGSRLTDPALLGGERVRLD